MPLQLSSEQHFYRGKVRDVYTLPQGWVVMVASDRLSAFDVVFPEPIPHKGAILNQMAAHFLKASSHLVPNWLVDSPLPHVSLGKACRPIRVEMIVRGYLSGHAWRLYKAGHRRICGVSLPDGLKENQVLPHPILTPTAKAEQGHDEDRAPEALIQEGVVSMDHYHTMAEYALRLFRWGQDYAQERGLILVDTKYEFGLFGGEILLMDEMHTPDSSRYFYADTYEMHQEKGLPQRQLSKEWVRIWLMNQGFSGEPNQPVPALDDTFRQEVSLKYQELFSTLLGKPFIASAASLSDEAVTSAIKASLSMHKTSIHGH